MAAAFPLLVTAACGAGEDITAPLAGTLEVRTVTTGAPPDADGYQVMLDEVEIARIGVNASALRTGVSPGVHRVALAGLAANCVLDGPSPRAVTVVAGTTVSTSFTISCTAPPALGALEIGVSTSGVDPDPDGYDVLIGPAIVQPIPATGTARVEAVPAGTTVVRLGGVAGNCTAPRTVDTVAVIPNETAHVAFAVTCWPPLAGRLAYSAGSGISVVNADGTGLLNLPAPFSIDEYPDWSPDGGRLAFKRGSGIYTMNPDGTDTIAVTADTFPFALKLPRWSPDGRRILFSAPEEEGGGPLYLVNSDGTGLQRTSVNNLVWASWAPGGRRLAAILAVFIPVGETCCIEQGVYLIDPDGSDAREVVSPEDTRYDAVEWSPDGSLLALANEGGVYLSDTTGTQIRQIFTPTAEFAFIPVLDWSPDGSRLAFWVEGFFSEEPSRLYLVNADGSGLVPLATGPSFFGEVGLSWGP